MNQAVNAAQEEVHGGCRVCSDSGDEREEILHVLAGAGIDLVGPRNLRNKIGRLFAILKGCVIWRHNVAGKSESDIDWLILDVFPQKSS